MEKKPETEKPKPSPRNTKVEGCPGCTEETFRPPHYASPFCKSGGHNHCSCDACF
jgi:hypothetical protein